MARRSFAASVVVTVSLAELACTSTGGGEHRDPPTELVDLEQITRNPPDPSNGVGEDDGGDAPLADGGGDEPVADDRGDGTRVEPMIRRQPDGTCVELVNIQCPEGLMCNPPPPRTVPCPPDDSEAAQGEGERPDAGKTTRIVRRDDGTCWEHIVDFECPPPERATCNPPPPRRVECPPDQATTAGDAHLPEAGDPQRVFRRPDGQCWEDLSKPCPPDTRCNPPPPRRVRCPAELSDDP